MTSAELHIDRFRAGQCLRSHRHRAPYVALVLEGRYVEASFDGRFACAAGDLIVHPPFHAHANMFEAEPCTVINLPVPQDQTDLAGYRIARTSAPEALLRLARSQPARAGQAALEEACRSPAICPPQWLSRFLALLTADWPVAAAARACGVTPEHAGRVTLQWFGAPPSHLRREGRLRRALMALQEGASPAEAAAEAGFADQSHLTRVLRELTGMTPARFRAR